MYRAGIAEFVRHSPGLHGDGELNCLLGSVAQNLGGGQLAEPSNQQIRSHKLSFRERPAAGAPSLNAAGELHSTQDRGPFVLQRLEFK